ncbi:MAG: CAP domain-containing protein [Actinomycetota bacterium]|nr:CAP domain-containing protein [Actinomycetota bacterium]
MTLRGSVPRVALLVLATLLPASLLSAPADSAPSPQTTYANQAFTATNNQRAAHDLVKLNQSSCLKRFAAAQAQKMANQGRIFHQPLAPIANRCHLRAVGENVAYGYPNGNAVVRAWMNSPGHRANILNRIYRRMAIAARQSSQGTWYVAQVFGRRL